MAVTTMIGARIHRREDPRLVTGQGHYVADFTLPHTAFAAIVRSPYAHARINSIDLTAASKAPGVVAIYTHKDFAKFISGGIPVAPAFVAEKSRRRIASQSPKTRSSTRAKRLQSCSPTTRTRRWTRRT